MEQETRTPNTAEEPEPGCVAKLDREIFVAPRQRTDPTPRFKYAVGFRVVSDKLVQQQGKIQTYRRVKTLENRKTGTLVYVQYSRARGFLKPYRCTVVGNDATGVAWPDLAHLNDAFDNIAVQMVELAFDFDPSTGIDLEYVRKHGLFGRCLPIPTRKFPNRLRFGSRKSRRLVRCYWKEPVNAFRVELQKRLRPNLLINNYMLYGHTVTQREFCFVDVNWVALDKHLSRLPNGKKLIRESRRQYKSLHRLLKYLRKSGVNNPHRFLTISRNDKLIRDACEKWRQTITPGTRISMLPTTDASRAHERWNEREDEQQKEEEGVEG